MKKKITTVLLCLALMSTGLTVFATTEKVGGETWKYWSQDRTWYSQYYHETKLHSTTLADRDGDVLDTSGLIEKDTVAKASCTNKMTRAEYAYWNTY